MSQRSPQAALFDASPGGKATERRAQPLASRHAGADHHRHFRRRCRCSSWCVYSFLEAAPYGGVEWKFSTDAYVNFLFQRDIFDDTLQFTPDYPDHLSALVPVRRGRPR